ASARTLVHFRMADGVEAVDIHADDEPLELLTRILEPIGARAPATVIPRADRDRALELAALVFRTFGGGRLDWRLNELLIHDWGSDSCGLPRGARSVDLVGDVTGVLRP
ncbi:MAG: hypothetical protein GWN71_15955, partial [Gammaproteobacteria bacterium]|nr:hypothetical protein [Gemmatimonadota bacterium]NIU75019.1 hypothetical protein [Gammaproteobacteria bacterium]NIX20970.1 hypothetical protein [Actinomycetota bacterium]